MANYLYNGSEFPDIYSVYTPELQVQNPYAVIINMNASVTHLYFSPNPFYVKTSYPTGNIGVAPVVETTIKRFYYDGVDSWCSIFDETLKATAAYSTLPYPNLWANHDVYYSDFSDSVKDLAGTVYMSASDPIPVNPAPIVYHTLTPDAMLMYWQVGRRIAS